MLWYFLWLQKRNVSDEKKWDLFVIYARNRDCGYSLEPPHRGGPNGYPQYMFYSRNKKINVYPCKPHFCFYIKVGFKGVKITNYKLFITYSLPMLTTWELEHLSNRQEALRRINQQIWLHGKWKRGQQLKKNTQSKLKRNAVSIIMTNVSLKMLWLFFNVWMYDREVRTPDSVSYYRIGDMASLS